MKRGRQEAEAPSLTPIENRPALQSFQKAKDVRVQCGCTRLPRRGWKLTHLLTHPIGVHEYVVRGAQPRFHAMFGPTTLGCFGSVEEAADTWDAEARRRGLRHVNQPGTGELSIIEAVRAIFASVTRLPLPPATYAWRAQRFAELMQSAHTGGIEAVWASSRDLQQALRSASCRVAHPTTPCHLDASRLRGQVDHASAAGTQLVISYQPHIFDTSKARSCEAGWQHAPPKPSVTAYFSRPECRARCVRGVVEAGEVTVPPELLRREAVIASGSWVLNFQCAAAAAHPSERASERAWSSRSYPL